MKNYNLKENFYAHTLLWAHMHGHVGKRMITPDQLSEGQIYLTTRGIAVIEDFYTENNLYKVHIRLHVVHKDCGVTATGQNVLMSTTPETLCEWINLFPRDCDERQKALSALKDMKPEKRDWVDEVMGRISTALVDGPKIKEV